MQRLLKVFGTDAPIVLGDEFGRSGRVSASSDNVLGLGGLGPADAARRLLPQTSLPEPPRAQPQCPRSSLP
jgi:hypothetical protein